MKPLRSLTVPPALLFLALAPAAAQPAGQKILTNGLIEIRFSTDNGAIVGLRQVAKNLELIAEPRLARNFRLMAPLPGQRYNYVEGHQQQLGSIEILEGRQARLRWSKLTASSARAPLDIDAELIVTLREGRPEAGFRLRLENHTPYRIEEAWLAPLSGAHGLPNRDNTRVYMAGTSYGHTISTFDRFSGTVGFWAMDHARRILEYPNGALRMQWLGLSNDQDALYCGLHDPTGDNTYLVLDLLPHFGQSLRGVGLEGTWPDPQFLKPDQPTGVQIAAAKLPYVEPGQSYEMPELVLSFQKGSWHACADRYREWCDTWMRFTPRPAWVKECDSWMTVQLLSQSDRLRYRYSDLPGLAEEAKAAGIRALRVIGWNRGGQDNLLPDHSTDPRLGTRQELVEAIRRCEAIGVRVILFIKFNWADRAEDWTKNELIRYAEKDPFGNPYVNSGWGYDTLAELTGLANRSYYVMCHSAPAWQEIALSEMKKARDLASSGAHIDESIPRGRCYDRSHGHPYGASNSAGWNILMRRFWEANHAARPEFSIVQEELNDFSAQYHTMAEIRTGQYGRENSLPIAMYMFPEVNFVEPIYGLQDRGLVNHCVLARVAVDLEPFNFKGRLTDIPYLTAYAKKVLELRRALADYLWYGKFRDVLDSSVKVEQGDAKLVRWSRFEHRQTGKPAIVLVNHARQAATLTVDARGAGAACTLYRPEAAPAKNSTWRGVALPPESLAVLVAQ